MGTSEKILTEFFCLPINQKLGKAEIIVIVLAYLNKWFVVATILVLGLGDVNKNILYMVYGYRIMNTNC